MELVANIWPVVDQETKIVQRFYIKAYAMDASDDEISMVLSTLARCDYRTAECMPIPQRFILNNGGHQINAATSIHQFQESLYSIIEDALVQLEDNFSDMKYCGCDYEGNPRQPEALRFPDEPYFVTTVLMEDSFGKMTPVL